MGNFRFYDKKIIGKFLSERPGETKVGQKIKVISGLEELKETSAKFVIFGIPEDIGVRANFGKPGTAGAWQVFLKAFLNVQHNQYFNAEEILLLGEVNTSEEMKKAENIDESDPNYHEKLGDLVNIIDGKVSEVVAAIISEGRIPIIIGGGHNNAFGNILGASRALKKPINVVNIDAHTDLRKTDYRHSGNGFSYGLKNGILERYSIFGLQSGFTPNYIFEEVEQTENILFSLFEDLYPGLADQFDRHLQFVNDQPFGCELDCDALANFPSSALSPSGFSLEEVRELLKRAAKEKNCTYLHICEASENGIFPTGKALSFLTTDFIKNHFHA